MAHSSLDPANLTDSIVKLACLAGDKIMQIKGQSVQIEMKSDNTPVTDADYAANKIILSSLASLTPTIPIVSEESLSSRSTALGQYFWLVDPLDGTKEFIQGSNEFTVNIALIMDQKPILGVIHVPATQYTYYTPEPKKAFRKYKLENPQQIHIRTPITGNRVALVSNSHREERTNAYLNQHNLTEIRSVGSSLKFCLVAEGKADIYPRFAPTMEWDTAAGHAIVNAAGGIVTKTDGKPLLYNKDKFKNPSFICIGSATTSC